MKIEPNAPPPPDEPERPRKFYALKPSTDFARANVPVADAADAPTDVRHHLRIAAGSSRAAVVNAPAARRTEVHDLLDANLARAQQLGLHALAPKTKRASKRKRDYWKCVIGLFLFVGITVLLQGPNPVNLIFGLAALVMGTITLTWVMFHLMEDY